jgi:hypothetical protein
MKQSVFRSAIDDGRGAVNAGYLALYWAMVGWSISTVALLIIGGIAVSTENAGNKAAALQATGVAIGAAAFGFATVVGAIAGFMFGDRSPHVPGPPGATTNVTVTQ